MTEFMLKEREDGTVALLELRPIEVGTFRNQAIANKVLAALMDDCAAEAKKTVVELDLKPEETAVKSEPEHRVAPVRTVAPKERPAPDDYAWADAFAKVAESKISMKDAADVMGVTFNQFRGKYASWCKHFNQPSQTETAKAAPEGEIDPETITEDCRLCGRTFKPSMENLETCARCSRD